jgi:hypothetical protein
MRVQSAKRMQWSWLDPQGAYSAIVMLAVLLLPVCALAQAVPSAARALPFVSPLFGTTWSCSGTKSTLYGDGRLLETASR